MKGGRVLEAAWAGGFSIAQSARQIDWRGWRLRSFGYILGGLG